MFVSFKRAWGKLNPTSQQALQKMPEVSVSALREFFDLADSEIVKEIRSGDGAKEALSQCYTQLQAIQELRKLLIGDKASE